MPYSPQRQLKGKNNLGSQPWPSVTTLGCPPQLLTWEQAQGCSREGRERGAWHWPRKGWAAPNGGSSCQHSQMDPSSLSHPTSDGDRPDCSNRRAKKETEDVQSHLVFEANGIFMYKSLCYFYVQKSFLWMEPNLQKYFQKISSIS